MPLGIIILLLGVAGYVVDFIENENKRQKRQQKKFPESKKRTTFASLMDPTTEKASHTVFWNTINSVFDTSLEKLKPIVKQNAGNPKVAQELSFDEEEFYEYEYEDEETFETELTTPMSMVIDEDPLYSDNEWETMTQSRSDAKVMNVAKVKPAKKRGSLQKAYIYSEIFGKPKGLE